MISNQTTQQSPADVYLEMSKKTGSTILARIYREQAAKLFNTHTHTRGTLMMTMMYNLLVVCLPLIAFLGPLCLVTALLEGTIWRDRD